MDHELAGGLGEAVGPHQDFQAGDCRHESAPTPGPVAAAGVAAYAHRHYDAPLADQLAAYGI